MIFSLRFGQPPLFRFLALGGVCWAFLLASAAAPAAVPPNAVGSFAPLVKKAAPAVVNIYARTVVKQDFVSPLFQDPFFRRFFGDQFGALGQPRERIQNSLGSGVIVGVDRAIVTNRHVIDGADQITVVLADRREFEATAISSDERSDLAILRIKADKQSLPYLELGDSDALEVGDIVLAIGNPFGVGQTVTSGIVSAVARTEVGITDYRSFIQTDAAINPGNSGGALIDMQGHLVGINTAIFSKSGGSQGIGFAIPAAMVRTVVSGPERGGRVVRPWLGATGQSVTAEIAQSLGLDRPMGVLIARVRPHGPADRAGLKTGDIVLRIAGHEVQDPDGLRFRIATQPLNTTAKLDILHDKQARTIEVDLSPPPEEPAREQTTIAGNNPLAGAVAVNLSPAVADELGLDDSLTGVVIQHINRGSAAERVGFAAGDMIVSVNGTEIANVAKLKEQMAKQSTRWRIAVRRGDQTVTLAFGG